MRFSRRRISGFSLKRFVVGVVFYLVGCSAVFAGPQREKTVWNYDDGIFISTEGSIPDGPCFKVSIRVTAPGFFENLKRTEVNGQTVFRRGSEVLTQFPDKLALSFSIRDLPCSMQLQPNSQSYLTPVNVESLRLTLFWKRGMALRPAKNISRVSSRVERIAPYATELADKLPERFEWFSQFEVPSQGVSLTDSLVLIFRTTDGQLAARVGARL
ncbi:MAG TPA: hypothetical protein VFF42_08335 [Candidatus Eremiobacteraceae bacterium]|nr:hypothetical protein [Candidatus Eremiobacteraceae bacterium]